MPQFAYAGAAPAVRAGPPGARRLDLADTADRSLLRDVLRDRVPVSAQFAVDGAPGAFVMSLWDQTALAAWYSPALQAVVVTMDRTDGGVCIVDVAALVVPRLADVLAEIGGGGTQVEVHFPPDRLDWVGQAVPAATATNLMVRGPFTPGVPFMIPETAAF